MNLLNPIQNLLVNFQAKKDLDNGMHLVHTVCNKPTVYDVYKDISQTQVDTPAIQSMVEKSIRSANDVSIQYCQIGFGQFAEKLITYTSNHTGKLGIVSEFWKTKFMILSSQLHVPLEKLPETLKHMDPVSFIKALVHAHIG